MSSLPARMRLIKSKMKELECSQDFSHYKSMGIFPDAQGQLTPQSLVRDVMNVLVTCKYEEDLIKNRGARVFTTLYVNFSDAQGQITLEWVVVSGRNLNSSKLSCMSSLPARMGIIESKMKELECSQDYSHNVYGDFSRRSRAANSPVLGPIWPNFELVRDVMNVLVTCKYEEDLIKNEGARVFTTFPHYKPMGAIRCHGHQSSDSIWPKTECSLSPTPMKVQIKFCYNWPTGCRVIQV